MKRTLWFLMGLVIGLLAILQLPYVQNKLFARFLDHLSEKTQFTIKHQYFHCKWFTKVVLMGFEAKDQQAQSLCSMKHLTLQVNPIQLLMGKQFTIKKFCLQGADFHLLRDKQNTDFNYHLFWQRLQNSNQALQASKTKTKAFVVQQASLQDIAVYMDDQKFDKVPNKWDLHHANLAQIAAELTNLQVNAHNLVVDIKHLAGLYEDQHLTLNKLCTQCKLTPTSLQLAALDLQTSNSRLQGNIQFTYQDIGAWAHFVDQVHILAQVDEIKLDAQELGRFVPYLKQHHPAYVFHGNLIGKVSDFVIHDFQVQFGPQQGYCKGQVSLQGLPNFQETIFDLRLQNSCFYDTDVLPYVATPYHQLLQQVKRCNLQGHLVGSLRKFAAQANLDTDLGNLTANLALTTDTDFQAVTYQGSIHTTQLALGALLGIDQLQHLTMKAQVAGQGVSLATAGLQIKAEIDQLGFNNYIYQDIHTEGAFDKCFFKGNLAVQDPNIAFKAYTTIDWRSSVKEIFLQGRLDKAVLNALGITQEKSNLSTDMTVKLQGSSLDRVNTAVRLRDLNFDLGQKPLYLAKLQIDNTNQEDYTELAISSDLFTIQAQGASSYTALVHDLKQFRQAYQQYLAKVPFTPQYTPKPYAFNYAVHLKDINALLYVFMPDVQIAPHTTCQGSFSQGHVVEFALDLAATDALVFRDYSWENTGLTIAASQARDGTQLEATGKLTAEKQQWGKHHITHQLLLDVAWKHDQLFFTSSLSHPSKLHELQLQGKADLMGELVALTLSQAHIYLSGCQWSLHPDNCVLMNQSQVQCKNLTFSHKEQQVSLEGAWSAKAAQTMHLQLHQFDLDNFSLLLRKKLGGIANGTVVLAGTLKQFLAKSDLAITNIAVDDLLVGDLQAKTDWDSQAQRLNVDCQLVHLQRPTVYLAGFYKPTDPLQSLQLVADLSKAQLGMVEPFAASLFSKLQGQVDGRFYIQGTVAKPQILGHARINHGTFKINYLNTLYNCDGAMHCTDKAIYVDALNLRDDQQGEAMLQGAIYHTKLSSFQLDLAAKMKDFKALDTTEKDNAYFYGTGMMTGGMTLTGPIDKIAIDIKATSRQGTNFTIPVQKFGKPVGQEDYIKFVNLKKPAKHQATKERFVQLKGLSLVMDLEVTPDAWATIILNANNGDAIQGRGKGKLRLKIDAEGTLSMTGNYELIEGKYTFAMYNLIKKQFKILEGSTITWYDQPYAGILRVQAAYDQRVSLTPLLSAHSTSKQHQDTSKYPVRVILDLQGVLSSPDIKFQFAFDEVPDNPDFQAAINSFLARTAAEEPYLMNQVFSLVVLKRFFSDNLAVTSSGTLGRSVGEFFSQQLSNFAAQLDENLEIDTDVDLSDLDKGARLKLAYNLLAGRLRIAREGAINLTAEQKTNVANIVGDWTLEYMLTKDRQLRLKLYNKHISAGVDTDSATTMAGGLSLIYLKSFNQWQELLKRDKALTKKEPPVLKQQAKNK